MVQSITTLNDWCSCRALFQRALHASGSEESEHKR
jgi:hypothetical protein